MSNCLNFESGPCGLFEVCIRSGKITSDNKMATTSIDLFADTTSFLKELITFNIFILCIGLVYVCTRLRNTIAQKIRARKTTAPSSQRLQQLQLSQPSFLPSPQHQTKSSGSAKPRQDSPSASAAHSRSPAKQNPTPKQNNNRSNRRSRNFHCAKYQQKKNSPPHQQQQQQLQPEQQKQQSNKQQPSSPVRHRRYQPSAVAVEEGVAAESGCCTTTTTSGRLNCLPKKLKNQSNTYGRFVSHADPTSDNTTDASSSCTSNSSTSSSSSSSSTSKLRSKTGSASASSSATGTDGDDGADAEGSRRFDGDFSSGLDQQEVMMMSTPATSGAGRGGGRRRYGRRPNNYNNNNNNNSIIQNNANYNNSTTNNNNGRLEIFNEPTEFIPSPMATFVPPRPCFGYCLTAGIVPTSNYLTDCYYYYGNNGFSPDTNGPTTVHDRIRNSDITRKRMFTSNEWQLYSYISSYVVPAHYLIPLGFPFECLQFPGLGLYYNYTHVYGPSAAENNNNNNNQQQQQQQQNGYYYYGGNGGSSSASSSDSNSSSSSSSSSSSVVGNDAGEFGGYSQEEIMAGNNNTMMMMPMPNYINNNVDVNIINNNNNNVSLYQQPMKLLQIAYSNMHNIQNAIYEGCYRATYNGLESGRHYATSAVTIDNNSIKRQQPSASLYYAEKKCVRCFKDFTIDTATDKYVTRERCQYHHGKLKRSYEDEVFYSCCYKAGHVDGCTDGDVHVWSGIEIGLNGPLRGFVKTPPKRTDKKLDSTVYAIDCEMCFTSRGLEVTKVSLVNLKGELVYDTYVKPATEVVDYNTRFSGVTEQQLEHCTKSLADVQRDLLTFIDEETILIGHGLENDLRVLKLIHTRVIDTSVLYPHARGYPYRRSLEALALSILTQQIHLSEENGGNGHDSIEDAKVCINLILAKVHQDGYHDRSSSRYAIENECFALIMAAIKSAMNAFV